MPKKKKELNPVIESVNENVVITPELDEQISTSEEQTPFNENEQDSFYKHIVKELNNTKNISTKTEYLSVKENYLGAKLEFFADYAYMPFLKRFVNIFETKRVSLHRKGRIEMIKALQEKDRELQNDRLKNLGNVFGIQ